MGNDKIGKLKKVGNWISAVLLGDIRELIARIDERTDFMKKDLDDIKPKVSDMFPKVDILWKDRTAPATSPRQLNEKGNAILEGSGIKEIVNQKKDELLRLVREKNVTNAYDADIAVLDVMKDLTRHCPDKVDELKNGAFRVGATIDDVIFVGSIYLRNLIFPELGFSLEDLDKSK